MEAAESGVEVRTIHIIYFLCRKGDTEDPHLIRVHQLSKNAIRLRDVKRWLAELRGKDMPESFAWLYKRKYKKGYVWQDLLDDDLITPHFNNEYVLKGSQISPSLISTQDTKEAESNISMQKEPLLEEAKEKPSIEEDHLILNKSSSEIEEELPESTLPNNFMKVHEEIKKIAMGNEKSSTKSSNNNSSSSTKSESHGSVKMFRNFITCRSFETKDSVIVPSVKNSFDEANKKCGEICKVQQKTNGKYSMNKPPNNGASYDGATEPTSFCSPRKSSAIYMPLNGPTCAQCGKQFKPEKLHRHMQSCKGIKAIAKASYPPANNAVENRPLNTAESIYRESVSAYLLTHS